LHDIDLRRPVKRPGDGILYGGDAARSRDRRDRRATTCARRSAPCAP
jgi:hypothetical protein